MRECPISYQSGISASGQISLMGFRYCIENSGNPYSVVRSAPEFSRYRSPACQSCVVIGECIGFKLARGVSCTRKQAEPRQNLLLQIGGNSRFAGVCSYQ